MGESSSEIAKIKPDAHLGKSSKKAVVSTIQNVASVEPKHVRKPKPFGENWEVKVAKKGAKLVGRGIAFGGKEGAIKGYQLSRSGADLVSAGARRGWKDREKLMHVAVGSALTIIAQNPTESMNVSREAYEQVVKQAGHVRDFGGEQPSKVALDAFTGSEKSNPLLESVVDTYYQGMVGKERERLRDQIELMGIYMADKVTAEGFENVAANEDIIVDECAKVDVKPGVVEGILFAETGGGVLGKFEDKTDAGALGPAGITDGLAIQHEGKDYGFLITNDANDPRLDWGKSIKFTCAVVGQYLQEFGDVSLATAAWHRGPTAVEDDIRFWANENGLAINGTIAGFSEIYGLNDWKLRQNKKLRDSWETDEADMTNIYPTRVAGSNFLKLNVEAIAVKQLEEANALKEE